jgi:hypothetical protein
MPAKRERLPPGVAALRPRARPRFRSCPCRMLRHRRTVRRARSIRRSPRARTRPFECCSGRACRQSRRRKRAADLGSTPPDSDRARCRGLHLHMETHWRAACSTHLGTSCTRRRRSQRRHRPHARASCATFTRGALAASAVAVFAVRSTFTAPKAAADSATLARIGTAIAGHYAGWIAKAGV